MFGSLKPKENRFFDLFREITELAVQAAKEFTEMLKDLNHAETHARNIKDIEHKADLVTHETIELLHRTFITPLDNDDIHQLIKEMDDVVDFIEAASQRIFLYGLTKATPEAQSLASIVFQGTECMKEAISLLNNLKMRDQILQNCVEINRLENEADQVLRSGIAKLFREEPDLRELIKLKEIYELLENVTDRCEDVANTIEGIVLEYA